jgi:hypothetical protein
LNLDLVRKSLGQLFVCQIENKLDLMTQTKVTSVHRVKSHPNVGTKACQAVTSLQKRN